MTNKKILALMFTATLMLAGCGGDDDDPIPSGKSNNNKNVVKAGVPAEVTRLEFPRLRDIGNNIVVVHKTSDSYSDGVNYSVEWDIEKKSQRWTCYQMMRGYRVTGVKPYDGNPLYPFDEDLPRYDYFSQDLFWGSGFDHGHICPKASRLYSDRANYQTFYLTNMQPQYHVFNAGIWVKLENRIRSAWTPSNSTDVLYVCKGGTIDNENQIIKRISGKLIVPKYFFTALLLKNSSGYRAVGFWFEHTADDHSEDNLKDYAISIDALEQLTGIDFFCNLPDDIEAEVEASYSPKAWGLN
jgi:endonuclease G